MLRPGNAQECITSFDPQMACIGVSEGRYIPFVTLSLRIDPISSFESANPARAKRWASTILSNDASMLCCSFGMKLAVSLLHPCRLRSLFSKEGLFSACKLIMSFIRGCPPPAGDLFIPNFLFVAILKFSVNSCLKDSIIRPCVIQYDGYSDELVFVATALLSDKEDLNLHMSNQCERVFSAELEYSNTLSKGAEGSRLLTKAAVFVFCEDFGTTLLNSAGPNLLPMANLPKNESLTRGLIPEEFL